MGQMGYHRYIYMASARDGVFRISKKI